MVKDHAYGRGAAKETTLTMGQGFLFGFMGKLPVNDYVLMHLFEGTLVLCIYL